MRETGPQVTGLPKTLMLAAGGTGGHLFPAYALAEEMGRRGVAVDLVTDMRGDRYGTGFPARAVHQVPSATLAGKDPVAMARAFRLAVEAGRLARRAGRIPRLDHAEPTSPQLGLVGT